jgi:hypothetical protein
MAITDKLRAMKGRSQDQATRLDSRGDSTANGVDVDIDEVIVYKVYKRRWLGVAIIMLLNIVSSWRCVPG